ncbi:helix-turn-helix domain-containing protein [Bacillus sp. ISL-41]|uniref:helix-turn-helix domain-containing protein n=1 Tax=Bacillus sp. ISL-41 TaxID=2819127 RepID=UPI001BEC5EF4|nr:helix-turn-helix transcriptional regulator [Bacillus sp. ISL-41]MBT2641728.1 helix-turn-helix domain-containing protein [Bacillus sp. ISL-41]
MESKEFGEYLRSLRKRKGLTINQLEELSGISNAYISQIETGKRRTPSPEILQKLSSHLGVSHEHLMQKAGYMQNTVEHHSPYDLLQILQQDEVYFSGIKLSPQHCKLLREILKEFVKTSKDT